MRRYSKLLHKVNNKINNINDIKKIITKIMEGVRKNLQPIYGVLFFKLKDDPQLRQAELNKINAKIDNVLNFVWNKICKENKISSKKINRDKHKDFDRYLSNKLELLERVHRLLCDIISEIENKTHTVYERMYKVYKKGIDKLHLINSKLNEFMRKFKKYLRNIISLADLLEK